MSLRVSALNLCIIVLLLLFVATILVSLHQGVAHGLGTVPGLVFHRCSSNGHICQNLQSCDDQGILALPCLPSPCKTEKKKKEKLNHKRPHSTGNVQGQAVAVRGGHVYHVTTSVVICTNKWITQQKDFAVKDIYFMSSCVLRL